MARYGLKMTVYQLLFFGSSPNLNGASGYIWGHNFWPNQDLDPLSTSKWPSEPQFCEKMARNGRTKDIYKGTFVCIQTLIVIHGFWWCKNFFWFVWAARAFLVSYLVLDIKPPNHKSCFPQFFPPNFLSVSSWKRKQTFLLVQNRFFLVLDQWKNYFLDFFFIILVFTLMFYSLDKLKPKTKMKN